jgi:hypothetical protein
MEKQLKKKIEKLIKEGWIKSWMMIETMAISKETVESALKKHMEKLEKEKGIMVYKKDFKGIKKVEKPLPNIPEGYSQVVEFEILTINYDKLVYIVLNYGPSTIEILEPGKITMDLGEAQGIVNSLATLIHRFAATRGGIMIAT